MKIVEKELSDLKPYENNPRINDEAVEPVAESIKQFGFKVPIIIDSNGVIIAGHTRFKAAQLLEMKKIPCVIADDLTPEQIKAFRIADNKTAEFAEWDLELLSAELDELTAFDIDMSAFNFDDDFFGFGEDNGGDYEDDTEDDLPDEVELPRDGKNTSVQINTIQYNGSKIPISDEEKALFDAKIDQYMDEHKVMFGFIGWLIRGGQEDEDAVY